MDEVSSMMKEHLTGLMETIVERQTDLLIERLKPLLSNSNKSSDDVIFDVKGLAAYLHVDENWIYQRTRRHEIPLIKKGKYCFFRKSVIDAWLDQDAVKPLSAIKFTASQYRRLSDK